MDERVDRIESRPEAPPISTRPAPSRRGRIVFMLLLVLAAGALVWLKPWTMFGPGKGRGVEPPQPVREATATLGDIPITFSQLGTVSPLQTVTVKTQIAGQLVQIAFKEGQLVNKGDFLAQIDPRPYQVALEQAQGALTRDQAALKNAQLDLARYQKLASQDSIAHQQVDTQAALVQQDIGTVKTDQAAIDSAQLNLTYAHIVSPGTGRLGLRQVDEGNYVQTSDANGLVVLTQLQPISVIFTLPEDDIPQVQKRMASGATLPVTAYDRSNTTELASGTLDTVDNQIDTTTGTVKLRAMFPNTDNTLFPSQFVNAHLLVDTLSQVVTVPSAAIQTGTPGNYVYLVQPDGTVTVRKVQLGPTDGERVAVLSGLAAGDKVVIDGADRLREGAKVTDVSTTQARPGGQGAGRGARAQADGAAAPAPASTPAPAPTPAPAH